MPGRFGFSNWLRSLLYKVEQPLVLSLGLGAVLLIQFFFFIILPQSWGLIDDYNFALTWNPSNVLQKGPEFLRNLMNVGRCRPVDTLYIMFRFGVLPLNPRYHHFMQFVFFVVSLRFVWGILKHYKLDLESILFALLAISANLVVKEWIIHPSGSESFATMFLMGSVYFFLKERNIWAGFFFVLSFLSKESFFIFLPIFFLMEYWRKRSWKELFSNKTLYVMTLCASAFFLFIKTLPAIYTAGMGVGRMSLPIVLTAFVFPPLKSFFPVFLFLFSLLLSFKKVRISRSDGRLPALSLGLFIVFIYTLAITMVGPFDSWAYLHAPIPFGWGIVFGGLYQKARDEWGRRHEALPFAGILAILAFFLMSTINGGMNVMFYLRNAKTMAEMVCSDFKRNPKTRFFSNCYEGSEQLRNYLLLTKKCENPPLIQYLDHAQKFSMNKTQPPYVLVWSQKCDVFDMNSINATDIVRMDFWAYLRREK